MHPALQHQPVKHTYCPTSTLDKKQRCSNAFLPPWPMPMTVLVILILLAEVVAAQELRYSVIRNNDTIGTIRLHRDQRGNTTHYAAYSDVSTQMVFSVNVSTKEESRFESGILQYSLVNRQVNGKASVKKETLWDKGAYLLLIDGKPRPGTIKEPIKFNFIQLYFEEPIHRNKVYCDNQHAWAGISPLGKGSYKILLPDGNVNEFHYRNGKCVRVDIQHRFYSFSFILMHYGAAIHG